MMQPFRKQRGIVAKLERANVDTDQIIPKQYLKSVERTGFGEGLFSDWRYNEDGSDNPEFELNQPRYEGASILVAMNNFGCGSSREHAVWAIMQYGFRVVVAPRKETREGSINAFADIFRNNGFNNGLLTVELSQKAVDEIMDMIDSNVGLEATVDLEEQKIVLHTDDEPSYSFEIDPVVRRNLLEGKDPIAQTLESEDAITAFENEEKREIFSPDS